MNTTKWIIQFESSETISKRYVEGIIADYFIRCFDPPKHEKKRLEDLISAVEMPDSGFYQCDVCAVPCMVYTGNIPPNQCIRNDIDCSHKANFIAMRKRSGHSIGTLSYLAMKEEIDNAKL